MTTRSIERWRREDAVRKVEVAYITDEQMRPVDFWWQQLCSEIVPLGTIYDRSSRGKWVARRDRYRASIQQDLLRKHKAEAVAGRMAEMREIQEIRQNTLELVQPQIVAGNKVYRVHPSSYEGMVRALIAIDALAEAKRDSVLRLVDPDLVAEIQKPSTVFSPDEIRSITRMLLESRRSKQQARLEAPALAEAGASDGEGNAQEDDDSAE